MRTSVRVVLLGGWAALGSGLCLLGLAWHRDRTREWSEPRWEDRRFERLAGSDLAPGTGLPAPGRARRVMAVNPRCPHCLAHLRSVVKARPGETELGVLIVDAPRRPSSGEVEDLSIRDVWWDRDGLWREAWGHRRYGEILEFDATGRHVATIDP